MADLKQVYQAPNAAVAQENLVKITEKWHKYSAVLKPWINNWELLSNYFKYSPQIRKMVYTTNAIEGFHRQLRKYTKTKGAFTSENALIKLAYCAITRISKKWNQPVSNWALVFSEWDQHFQDRLSS